MTRLIELIHFQGLKTLYEINLYFFIALIFAVATAIIFVAVLLYFIAFRTKSLKELAKLNEELIKSSKLSQETLETQNKFIANISHEIRTPLNAIIGLTNIIMNEVSLPDEVIEKIENINNCGAIILEIITDILDLSKFQSSYFKINSEEYDLTSLIHDVLLQNSVRIHDSIIKFKINISSNIPNKLLGDELRIKQVINNLLSNAFKYTLSGSVTFNFNFLSNRHDETTGLIDIQVIDTGIGIKDENIELIFKPFFQITGSDKITYKGTGLGLPITKNLVDSMGGSIRVESKLGLGTTFFVQIPQIIIDKTPVDKQTINILSTNNFTNYKLKVNKIHINEIYPNRKILIVDDSEMNLEVAKGILKPYKVQTEVATSGLQVLQIIKDAEVEFDIIFLDLMMPGMDGIATLKQIRQINTEYAKNIPVIAFTANAFVEQGINFADSGFADFISKPVDLQKLDQIVRKYLSISKINLVQNKDECNEYKTIADEYFSGDLNLLSKIYFTFLNHAPKLMTEIKNTYQQDITTFKQSIHKLKGNLGMLGQIDLQNLARDLEKAAIENDLAFIETNLSDFERKMDEFLHRITIDFN